MFSFFKRQSKNNYRIILGSPPPKDENLSFQTEIAFIYVYPSSSNQGIFEYRIPDVQNERYYTGEIRDQSLVEALKKAPNIHELALSEQTKLCNLSHINKLEQMLASSIQRQSYDTIKAGLQDGLGKAPTEEAINTCLDNLVDELFRTPEWEQMLETAKQTLKSSEPPPSGRRLGK